jgi:hypothetical protein
MAITTSTVFDSEYAINWYLQFHNSKTILIDGSASQTVKVEADGLDTSIKISDK